LKILVVPFSCFNDLLIAWRFIELRVGNSHPNNIAILHSKHLLSYTRFLTTTMPESNQSIESRMQLAILESENVEKPNIKAWARSRNLPYHRLLAR
jgi:hypothetical protein